MGEEFLIQFLYWERLSRKYNAKTKPSVIGTSYTEDVAKGW